MVRHTLPCAEKKCKSKMTITENNDNLLYYNCFEQHYDHAFRYNIGQKKWERIIIKSKILLHYNEDPFKDSNNANNRIEKNLINPFQESEKISNLLEIKGIGSKRVKELELAGIKTISDLAKCSPAHLSEKTGISISQISNWIIESNKLARKAEIISA